MNQKQTVEINGIELEEGDTLWRYAALRTWGTKDTFGEQDPDDILREVAEALAENYPDAVDNQPAEVVHTNLRANPGIYDDTDLIRYHAMEVERINTSHGTTEITIKDWKEEKTYAFRDPPYEDSPEGRYTTFEPLSALEKHLGVTVLPVDEEE